MPTQIDCPECGGEGNICTNCGGDCWEGANKLCEYAGEEGGHICDDCEDGKITVYTEADMKKTAEDEREACIKACLNGYNRGVYDCAEAIRARGKP